MMYLAFVTTAVTVGLCWFARPLADWLHVFDYPRGGRKAHPSPTPQTGGFAILVPLIGWLLVSWLAVPGEPLYRALLLCGAGLGIVGVMDDQSHLSAAGRLLLLAVFTLIAFALDPLLVAPTLPWATFSATPLAPAVFIAGAVLATMGFVSSVNMADGIDGLVPAAVLIWCAGFDIFGAGAVREISLALSGPVLVVLVFNLRRQVFLGDCGTFGIGFIMAVLAIASLRSGTIAAETLLVWFWMPVLDCLRVIAARLLRGRSPLRGGKDHFHHILADVFGRRRALYVYAVTIFATSLGAALAARASFYILVALTASCLGFVAARRVLYERQKLVLAQRPARKNLSRPKLTQP
jgi:UDP-GlcNAc:undecaprenyl-phosphate GlcNAc-1-phosphate transferase